MYEMSGSAEKLNIQNFVKSKENCAHFMYEMSRFAEKLNIQNYVKKRKIVYIICTEYPNL